MFLEQRPWSTQPVRATSEGLPGLSRCNIARGQRITNRRRPGALTRAAHVLRNPLQNRPSVSDFVVANRPDVARVNGEHGQGVAAQGRKLYLVSGARLVH